MFTLFTIPSATTTISDIGSYSAPWFTEFLLFGVVIAGILLAGMGVSKLISVSITGAKKVLGGRGRGGRRMRR